MFFSIVLKPSISGINETWQRHGRTWESTPHVCVLNDLICASLYWRWWYCWNCWFQWPNSGQTWCPLLLYSTVKRNRRVIKQSGIPLGLQDLMCRRHLVHPFQRQKCMFKYSFKESSHKIGIVNLTHQSNLLKRSSFCPGNRTSITFTCQCLHI